MSEKIYSRVKEAEVIVKKLCEKYPDILWAVKNPETIAVLGIENKERSEKNRVLAKIHPISAEEKAIFQESNIPIRYIISLYYSDFNNWNDAKKQWILFHELLHVYCEEGKTVKHDCQDFKIILSTAGIMWTDSKTLPNLINDDVKFDLSLRPAMEVEDEEPKKRGRPKKVKEEKDEEKDEEDPFKE